MPWGPRRNFNLRHALPRALLCRELDCGSEALSFVAFNHGQPFLAGRRVSRARLLQRQPPPAAWRDRDGGVDVEERTARRKAVGVSLRLEAATFGIPSAICQGATSCLMCLPVTLSVQGRLARLVDRRFSATLAVEELAASNAGDSGRPPFA